MTIARKLTTQKASYGYHGVYGSLSPTACEKFIVKLSRKQEQQQQKTQWVVLYLYFCLPKKERGEDKRKTNKHKKTILPRTRGICVGLRKPQTSERDTNLLP